MTEHNSLESWLRDEEVAARYGVTRRAVWRWIQTDGLPAPVKLTSRCTRWRLSDLVAWEASRQANAA